MTRRHLPSGRAASPRPHARATSSSRVHSACASNVYLSSAIAMRPAAAVWFSCRSALRCSRHITVKSGTAHAQPDGDGQKATAATHLLFRETKCRHVEHRSERASWAVEIVHLSSIVLSTICHSMNSEESCAVDDASLCTPDIGTPHTIVSHTTSSAAPADRACKQHKY